MRYWPAGDILASIQGAVYTNFRNKEDLFLGVLGWIHDHAMDDPELAADDEFLPTVMAFLARGLLTAPVA